MALIILQLIGKEVLPPTGITLFSCKTLNNFVCIFNGIEFNSSKNNVPPFASSNRPLESRAPVKAPFTVPNRILSNRFSGIAEQFKPIKGSFALLP
jgi:hypothetical protein